MRALRAILAIALLTTIAATGTASAQAATTPIPGRVSIKGAYGQADLFVPIPDGTQPRRFSGRVVSTYTAAGDLVITVNDRAAAKVPANRGGRFSINLGPRDNRNGGVRIGLRADLRPNVDCFLDNTSTAVIRGARMSLNEAAAKPTTLQQFLSPGASSYLVVVPPDASAAEQTGGLNAVLALRHITSDITDVRLAVRTDPPPTTDSRRVVVVDETEGPNSLSVVDHRLVVAGGQTLPDAATSIADPNTVLLDLDRVTDLPGTADYRPASATATFKNLGVTSLSTTGIGKVSQTVTMTQAAFGRSVEQMIFNVYGSVTPVQDGQQGRVNLLWNDNLVASRALSYSSRLTLSFTAPPESLRAVNYLTLELEYLPSGSDCSNPPLPGTAQVDVDISKVTPEFGISAAPGFQRFPQAFGPVIPVATGGELEQSLESLATVLTAAVAPSPLQYTVELVEPGKLSGAAVGSGLTDDEARSLAAPLPGQKDNPAFPAGISAPYAWLQAFQSGDSDLIILSGEPTDTSRRLADWSAALPWASMAGQVYVLGGDSARPEAFDAPTTAPQTARTQLYVGIGLTVLLIGLLVLWLRMRPRKG